jgi:hypothetical protein
MSSEQFDGCTGSPRIKTIDSPGINQETEVQNARPELMKAGKLRNFFHSLNYENLNTEASRHSYRTGKSEASEFLRLHRSMILLT